VRFEASGSNLWAGCQLANAQPTPGATRTLPGIVVGTVGYMAPKQLTGEGVDHRTSVFAFGVVFHEMLTGVVRACRSPCRALGASPSVPCRSLANQDGVTLYCSSGIPTSTGQGSVRRSSPAPRRRREDRMAPGPVPRLKGPAPDPIGVHTQPV